MNQKKIVINELPTFQSNHKYLIVDDIYDSGDTFRQITAFLENKIDFEFASLYTRYNKNNSNRITTGKILNHDKWVVFPWEKDDEIIGE